MIKRRTTTVDEAAQALGVSRNAAYSAIRRGEIPAIRIGDRRLVPIIAIERRLAGEPALATGERANSVGALDLEPPHVLLEHLAKRLAMHARDVDDDGRAWATGGSTDGLLAVVEVLLDRVKVPRL